MAYSTGRVIALFIYKLPVRSDVVLSGRLASFLVIAPVVGRLHIKRKDRLLTPLNGIKHAPALPIRFLISLREAQKEQFISSLAKRLWDVETHADYVALFLD